MEKLKDVCPECGSTATEFSRPSLLASETARVLFVCSNKDCKHSTSQFTFAKMVKVQPLIKPPVVENETGPKPQNSRVCVFIDGSNFYFALKRNNHPTRVEYHELSKALTGPDRQLIRTYYYNSAYDAGTSPEQAKTQQSFLDSLDKTPYLDLRLGRMSPLKEGGFKVKGVEVRLSSDLVYYAARGFYDTAVVITEDMDFACVLAQVKELGRRVEVCFFKDNQPRELLEVADNIIHMQEVLDKFSSMIFPGASEDNVGNRAQVSKPKPFKKQTEDFLKTKKFYDDLLRKL